MGLKKEIRRLFRHNHPEEQSQPPPAVIPAITEYPKEPYPTKAFLVLQRIEEIALRGLDVVSEIDQAYAAILKNQQKTVEAFKELAGKKKIPWAGRIQGGMGMNEQDGLTWYENEGLVVHEEFLEYVFSQKLCHGSTTEELEHSTKSTPDTSQLISATYTKRVVEGCAEQEKREILQHIELRFQNGLPLSISVINNSGKNAKYPHLCSTVNLRFSPS